MKKTAVGFVVLLFVVQCRAQVQWSPPVQISHGHGDDTHPSFANSMYGFGDMLTFSRFDSQRYSICIVTNSFASNWDDTTIFIAHDSVRLDYPTLTESGSFPSKRMLVWQRGDTLRNLWFSSDFGGGWSMPAPLTNDTLDNRFPYLSPTYSGDVFGLVWQRADRIAFTEFTTGSWLPPISISDSSDTITARPSLKYTIEIPGVSNPLVVWGGKEFLFPSLQYEPVVRYAVRTGNGWFISLLCVNTDAMYHPRLIKNSPWGADLTYEGGMGRTGRFTQAALPTGAIIFPTLRLWMTAARLSQRRASSQQSRRPVVFHTSWQEPGKAPRQLVTALLSWTEQE